MRRTPVLIVGGGPAGTAAAIALGRGGAAPELIERSAGERDVVCGGFLGRDALGALARLGIDAEGLGAKPIGRLRLVAGDRVVEADLPWQAAGLSRRRLDEAMLDAAAAAGARVVRGCAVRAADPDGHSVRLDDGDELEWQALFLATGKHELRGAARPLDAGGEEPAVGLRAALPPSAARSAALGGMIELHLFDEGYAGLLLQEDGSTNLCLSVSRRRLAEAGSPERLVAQIAAESPRLGDRIGGGGPDRWDAIAGVPYGWRAGATQPGLFRIGDQGAVIASLAGDGVAIALTSGSAAAEAFLAGGPEAATHWQRDNHRRSAVPLGVAQRLRRIAEHRRSRALLMPLLGLVPGMAAAAARLTRIDSR